MADKKTSYALAESRHVLRLGSLKEALDQATRSGISVDVIIKEGLGKGMEIVGEKYEKGEYFLSDLIMGGVVMNEAMERLRPILTRDRAAIMQRS